MTAPRVSILIPNFNNGRDSSLDGQTDLLGDLLASLQHTLADDPTPVEIIAYDDGSTDDSLATLRAWAETGILRLIEAEHSGVLSKAANTLVKQSSGDILVRLDGDTLMLTSNWAQRLVAIFDQAPPRLGVVGPKQLAPNGLIHAYGDWLLHPKGYHHIAAGLPRHAVTRPLEVDHVMGCFYCCRRQVHDEVGGYDENILRGQTVDFGLRARLAGFMTVVVPHIEFVHRHGLRRARATAADQLSGLRTTLQTFREKWGFDRIAPDLDAVRSRYRGTGLLWNAKIFAMPPGPPASANADEQMTIENTGWGRYTADEAFRRALDLRVDIVAQVIAQLGRPKHVAIVGGGAGPLAHLLAKQDLALTAVDSDRGAVALARKCVKNQSYPGPAPRFVCHDQNLTPRDSRRLPLETESCDMVLLFDQIERHDNPVALINELGRVLVDAGVMVIVTARPTRDAESPWTGEHRYHLRELMMQIQHAHGDNDSAGGPWCILTDPARQDGNHPITLIARRAARERVVGVSADASRSSTYV
jgi:GT2 family glycosyltransferase